MRRFYLDPGQPLLDERFPMPLDRPFTTAAARAAGLHAFDLGGLVAAGHLRRPIRGVYVAAQVPDCIELRAEVLRLVVPPHAVVTDRTAGWLHGAQMVLAPNDHLVVPTLSVFADKDRARLRNGLTSSGQRILPPDHVTEVLGVRVSTPARTACDLGRLLHRDQAFAALDSMLALAAFSREELWAVTQELRGMRGVRQLRAFIPLADGRSQSQGESVTRLRWLDLGLAAPELQVEVPHPGGWSYWIDLGVPELRFGIEYDGEEWHRRTEEQRARDDRRRKWLREERDWMIRVVTKDNIHGHDRDIETIIPAGLAAARRRLGLPR
jgi:hypothetical protein